MLPATHILTGYLIGRSLSLGSEPARGRPWYQWFTDPFVLVAVAASLLPDCDVIPGLISRDWTVFHRGPTHSLLAIPMLGGLFALLARPVFVRLTARPLPATRVIAASVLGVASHTLWDFMNRWGVQLAWPVSPDKLSAELIHEADLLVFLGLALASVVSVANRRRAAVVIGALLIAGYLGFQAWWRSGLLQAASLALPHQEISITPQPSIEQGWIIVGHESDELAAYRPVGFASMQVEAFRRVPLPSNAAVTHCLADQRVQDYRDLRLAEFAQLLPGPDGSTIVLWRDLFDEWAQKNREEPYGLYVTVSPAGKILGVRENWMLLWWYW